MKRRYIFMIMACCLILLSGCGHADITCKITEEFEAVIDIELVVNTEGMNAQEKKYLGYTMNDLQQHWRDVLTQSKLIKRKSTMTLNGYMYKKADSTESAYDALLELMTDDVSPFDEVNGGYTTSFFKDQGYLSAKLDLTKLVDTKFVEELPESQRTRINEAIAASTARVIFQLPGETTKTTGTVDGCTVYQDATLDKPITLSVNNEIVHTEHHEEYDALNTKLSETKKTMIIFGIVLGAVLLLIIIAAFVRKVAKEY